MRAFFIQKCFFHQNHQHQHQNVTREKLRNYLLHKKRVHKMLMRLTTVVNFINILRAHFSYKSYVLAAFLVTFWLWRQNFVQKKIRKNVDEIDTRTLQKSKWRLTLRIDKESTERSSLKSQQNDTQRTRQVLISFWIIFHLLYLNSFSDSYSGRHRGTSTVAFCVTLTGDIFEFEEIKKASKIQV